MYNHNFNYQGNWYTFQNIVRIPPPPRPPPYLIPPMQVKPTEPDDVDLLKYYVSQLPPKIKTPQVPINISLLKEKLKNILLLLNNLKVKENVLRENMNTFSDEEWTSNLNEIEKSKKEINETLNGINQIDFNVLKKLVAKRHAKRMRLKRLKAEIKAEKEQRNKDRAEKSRKIDEYLQRVQDDINKTKQDEEAKAVADTVLKDVLRKKQDAKKCLVKLDALIKLRKAKMNTAKGRGEKVSEQEAIAFNNNIEKLKLLWNKKLSIYEKEEADLRSQLAEGVEEVRTASQEMESEVRRNLLEWRVALFGGTLPQGNYVGDMERFVQVRSQWDQYASVEGSPIPAGWVPPAPAPAPPPQTKP